MTISYQCCDLLSDNKYFDFFESIPRVHSLLTEEERQDLLKMIISHYYKEEYATKFKTAFDLIIGEELNLDFGVWDYAPSLLSLVVYSAPYIELFDYFLKKGAHLNFVGENLDDPHGESYLTCLDFADECIHNFKIRELPSDRRKKFFWNISPVSDTIWIRRVDYLNLSYEAESFRQLVMILKLRDHIIMLGGKRKSELEGDWQV